MSAHRGWMKISALSRRLLLWVTDSVRARSAEVWTIVSDLIHELQRLNGLGVRSDEGGKASRRRLATIVRKRLEMRYRDRSPCC
jgi:hypothetical protein